MTASRKPITVTVVYAAALLQGLTVVSIPASASVLKAALDDAQYGAIFVPQMLATIAGSLLAGRLGARALSGHVLAVALLASALAEALLACVPYGGGFVCALAATAALGLGFGLSAAALNAWPGQLFPRRAETALVALHTVLASGFAFGPALASASSTAGIWLALPIGIGTLAILLAGTAVGFVPAGAFAPEASDERSPGAPITAPGGHGATAFLAIAVLYALAEGTFANWAVVYLREERALSEAWAALALSTFWFALASGRLIASALLVRIAALAIWRALPVAMALAFLALPLAHDPRTAVIGFGFAGLSCSAFFPLTVSLGARRFRGGASRASSLLTAALMVGVGLGSFAIGPLRGGTSLAVLYRYSAAYPLLALALCLWVSTRRRSFATKRVETAPRA